MLLSSYSMNTEELQEHCDGVKDLILVDLYNEGLLTQEQIEHYSKTHTCVVKRLSTISRYLAKFFNKENDKTQIIVAKIPNLGG